MARHREAPRCPYCNKIIATPIYEDRTDVPKSMRKIGDNFKGWNYIKHKCRNMPKVAKILNKIRKR